MIKVATNAEANSDFFKKTAKTLKDKYLKLLDTIGEDLLGDYKLFELPYIIGQIEKEKVKRILDFGTGASCLPAYLDSLGYEVWALDDGSWHPEINEFTYNEVYKSKVKYVVADLLKNPDCVPDGYFDIVCSASVLEHIKDYEKYLKILNKKLKKGGTSIHVVDLPIDDIYQPEEGMTRLVIENDVI